MRRAHAWARWIRRLVRIERCNRRGEWKLLIAIAGKKPVVSRAGLPRLMMLESADSRTAGGMYRRPFQCYPGT